ncbi:unnamed protein product [Caenorhabditis angaria]|uniref:Cytochrome b561 domain-containing protein n=1 Tax=Caenorhabditis angaria TaxID=860376 RepID=A0A9P1I7S6_9PELO|nr:unnamed protein product [Caenorhabditis angaria]
MWTGSVLWLLFCFLLIQQSHAHFDGSQCGKSKSCHIPTTCPEKCHGMGAAWKLLDDDSLELELFVNSNTSTGRYVAIGFSDDDKMGNEPVIECSSLGDEPISMKFSFDKVKGKGNQRIPGDFSEYFTKSRNEFHDGMIYCKSIVKISGHPEVANIFKHDPTRQYNLLLVNGLTKPDGISYHKGKQDAIAPKMLLSNTSYGAITPTQTEESPDFDISSAELQSETGTLEISASPAKLQKAAAISPKTLGPFDSSSCGKSKGCTQPIGDQCYGEQGEGLGGSYRILSENQIEFEIFGPVNVNISQNVYVAMGFSNDTKMNDISVIECSKMPGETNPTMKFSYNQGFENVRIDNEPTYRAKLINLTSSSIQDAQIYCKGIVNVGGSSDNSRVFKWDSTQRYYLLFASGPTDASGLHHHTGDCTSGSQIFLDQVEPMFDSSQCSKSKACFTPTDCGDDNNCNSIQASWKIVDSEHIEVELTGNVNGTNSYIALGFSTNGKMGNASVIDCSSFAGNKHSMSFSYNLVNGHYFNLRPTADLSNLIANERTVLADGVLYCTAVFKVVGDENDPAIFKYDPKQEYNLLLATGTTKVNRTVVGLNYHFTKRSLSTPQLLSQIAITTTTPPPPSGDIVVRQKRQTSSSQATFDSSTCGTTKACYTPSADATIAYKLADNNQDLELEISSTQASANGVYTAVGFGSASEMGPASVVECSALQGQALSMKFSANEARTNVRISGEETIRSQLMSNVETSYVDGKIYCKATIKGGGSSANSQIFNFQPDNKYYLLVAKGAASSSGLNYHGPNDRWISSQRLLSDTGAGNAGGKSTTLLILHAVFMTVAWLVMVPIAVIFARVLRASWPNTKPGGLLIWFQIHRAANLIAIALMIAAFVCILIYKNWKFPTEGWGGAHAITGVIALVLGWLQPIISVFRCGPADKLRPIFNITHRAIGVVALCLATTAIAIAGYHFTPTRNVVQLVLALIPITVLFGVSYFFLVFNSCLEKSQENLASNSTAPQNHSNRPNVVRVEPSSKSQTATTWTLNGSSNSEEDAIVATPQRIVWPHRFREFIVYAAVLVFIAIGAILSTFFANAF